MNVHTFKIPNCPFGAKSRSYIFFGTKWTPYNPYKFGRLEDLKYPEMLGMPVPISNLDYQFMASNHSITNQTLYMIIDRCERVLLSFWNDGEHVIGGFPNISAFTNSFRQRVGNESVIHILFQLCEIMKIEGFSIYVWLNEEDIINQ